MSQLPSSQEPCQPEQAPQSAESPPSAESPSSAEAPSPIETVAADTEEPAGVSDAHANATSQAAAAAPVNKFPRRGASLRGRIARTDGDEVFVDVGMRAQAVIPLAQFDNGSAPDVGVQVDLLVVGLDESAGLLRVYRRGAVVTPDVKPLLPGMLLEGPVTGMIKGGLEVQFGSLRGFMPASQVDTTPMRDISVLLGQTVRCEVLEWDGRKNKVIVSRRRFLKRQEDEARKALLTELTVGQVHKGVVVSMADFGAFVDLGGLRGLVHVSDLRWTPVKNPADVVKVGDEIDVKVLRISADRKRISLGHKQTTPDPWSAVLEHVSVGQQLKAKIVKLTDFGAFAKVAESVNGLIPLSEMSWAHRVLSAQGLVEVGQEVDVVVISVDGKRRRIGLSMKRLTQDPWDGVSEAFPAESVVTGKVSKLLEFGALVELRAGVEGMVHISELADRRVEAPGDVVKVGDDVETKVLGVDAKKRRISLTIKGLHAARSDGQRAADAPTKKRQRKKPLRGGLASHFEW